MIPKYCQLISAFFIQLVMISGLVVIIRSSREVDEGRDENICPADGDCHQDSTNTKPQNKWIQRRIKPKQKQQPRKTERNFPFNVIPRIINGVAAREFQFPYLVVLMSRMAVENTLCGGTILSDKFVLSAAHCFVERPSDDDPLAWLDPISFYYVVAGTNDPTAFYGWSPHTQIRFAKDVYVHTLYDIPPGSTHYDYSIFEVAEPFVLDGKHVVAKQLPHFKGNGWLTQQTHRNDVICTIAGWGTTTPNDVFVDDPEKPLIPLMYNIGLGTVDVLLRSYEECFEEYGYRVDEEVHICAGSYMKDTCQGDSGGPLSCYFEEGKLTLVGVVSFGRGCANPNFYGVYARLDNAETWIRAITHIDHDLSAGNGSERLAVELLMMDISLIYLVRHYRDFTFSQ